MKCKSKKKICFFNFFYSLNFYHVFCFLIFPLSVTFPFVLQAPEYILVHCSKLKAAISQAESSQQLTLVAAESPVIKTADLEAIQHIQGNENCFII